jgi:TPR repeat protein
MLRLMTMRRRIRAGCGVAIAATIATVFAGEVFAGETTRADGVSLVEQPGLRTASTVGDNRPSSSSRLFTDGRSIVEANRIEGIRLAAEGGVAQAQYDLGLRFQSGDGVSKDPVQALNWFRKAAEQGYGEAQYMLGCCYNGEEGFARDPSEAVKWWTKAAEQGHADAQHCLGLSYSSGEGVSRNPAEAARWWKKAAEQNHPDAQYFLGISYFAGLGVPKIPEQAAYWLGQAAAHGNEDAMAELKKLGADEPKRISSRR